VPYMLEGAEDELHLRLRGGGAHRYQEDRIRHGVGFAHVDGEVAGFQPSTASHDHGALHKVAEFTNVSRPAIAPEAFQRGFTHPLDLDVMLSRELPHEVLAEQ